MRYETANLQSSVHRWERIAEKLKELNELKDRILKAARDRAIKENHEQP
jgi:uncharacterized protein YjiS (DUF1127 family)